MKTKLKLYFTPNSFLNHPPRKKKHVSLILYNWLVGKDDDDEIEIIM